jgi:chorismate mutase
MPVRGIKGATTVSRNTKDEILDATRELLQTMVEVNEVDSNEVASAWFTTTPDVNAEFPAVAARTGLGWTHVPLMCGHEMAVPGSLPLCVRILLHVNTEKGIHDIHHVYLREARRLRPDLATSNFSTAR